jgi:crossover junction endodeoxyribonuclease RusA
MSESLKITLPMPALLLTPNGRGHWARKAKATKAARELARLLALAQGLPETAPTHYRLTYHWPTPRRRRDDDNCVGGCKAYLDGICSALRIDDRDLSFSGLVHDRSRPGQAGVSIEMWND